MSADIVEKFLSDLINFPLEENRLLEDKYTGLDSKIRV
jgi:hypothetical protein